MPTLRSLLPRLLTLALCLAGFAAPASADQPAEIRLVFPGVGNGNRPFVGGATVATMHLKGALEEEFRKDNIRVTWTFLRGAGPATNELYANGLADFSLLGDLPSIVGRSSGLKTRVLAATGIRMNTYLAVPADSTIQNITQLKGKRVAIFKGTNIQLAVAKILAANGLRETDIKAINMDTASAKSALITKDIDAVFSGNDLLALRDQGAARIVYNSAGDPRFMRHCSFIGSETFIKKYPEITKRVVKVLVQVSKWQSDLDANPTPVFQLWTKSGYTFSSYKEDAKGQSLKLLSSPLLDPYLVSQYKAQVKDALRFGLIKEGFDVDAWFEPRFLNDVLRELSLTSYWQPVDASGKPQELATK